MVLNVCWLPPQTAVVGPVIAAGVEVAFERASVLAVEAPRQLLAVTLKLPLVKPVAN